MRGSEPPPIAALQCGAFTVDQALAAGWSARQIRRRLETGAWRRLAGRALTAAAPPHPAETLAWAVRLTWRLSVVSHTTAAGVHRFPVGSDDVAHAIVSPGLRSVRGIRAHVVPLDATEVQRSRRGLRLTTPARTALDCLAALPPGDAFDLWAWVSTRGVLDAAGLATAVRARLGLRGTPALLALLKAVGRGAASPAERRLHALLDHSGLHGWLAGARIEHEGRLLAIADVLFPAERVVVEVDGWAAHSSRQAFVTDRRRQNQLIAAGYLVMRFTVDDLRERPEAVAAEIRRALSLR